MNARAAPKIVIICGPTASGKTGFAVELGERVGGEVVGADSLQVYRHLDIGTAKPSPEERARVHHHLVDVLNPDEPFNAALYKEMADECIGDILSRGRVPLVVGGTGLYMRVLIRGIFNAPKPDESLRSRLKQELEAYGVEQLHNRLHQVDPALAEKVEHHDRNRIIRGLEIFEQTGIPLSEHQRAHDFKGPSYDALQIGLRTERGYLYDRITQRTMLMIDAGLLDECKSLLEKGYGRDLKPMQSLGYRQICEFLAGEKTLEKAIHGITRETKRYAKRQLTWFRKDPEIQWVEQPTDHLDLIAADVRRFLGGEPLRLDWRVDPP